MKIAIGLIWFSTRKQHTDIQKACVDAIKHKETKHNLTTYIFVNRSLSSETKFLEESGANVIFPPKETSVAAGWNYLINKALEDGNEYVLVMNSDIIIGPDTIDNLVEFAKENSDFVAWGPSINKPNHEAMHWPPFACFMVNQRTKDLVGLFDEGFVGAYTEDTSFKYKVFKLGYKMIRSMNIVVRHIGSYVLKNEPPSKIRNEIQMRMRKNKLYFRKKHGIHPHEWRLLYNKVGMSAGGYNYPFDDPSLDWRDY